MRTFLLSVAAVALTSPTSLSAQTNLGMLRLGNGGAKARSEAFAETAYMYDAGISNYDAQDVSVDTDATSHAYDQYGYAYDEITADAFVTGPSYALVYAPQASAAVWQRSRAGSSVFAEAGGSEPYAVAGDSFYVYDAYATNAVQYGYIDVLVTAQHTTPSGDITAGAGSLVVSQNGRANLLTTDNGEYKILVDGNPVATIFTPSTGAVNVVFQFIDPYYNNPIGLGTYGKTGGSYLGQPSYVYDYGYAAQLTYGVGVDIEMNYPGYDTGSAEATISILSAFTVKDFSSGGPTTSSATMTLDDGDPEDVDFPEPYGY